MWLTANGMLSLWSVLWTVLSWACPRPDHRPYLPSTLHLIPHILHNLGYRLYLSICEFLMCREPQPITNWANKPNKEPGNQQPNTPTHQDSNKNRPKLCQKSTKKITKHQWVVWGALGASWDHLAKTPQDTQKAFQVTPPPGVPRWSQHPSKIDLEAFQKEVNFLIGFGVGFYTHFVPTWSVLWSVPWTVLSWACPMPDHLLLLMLASSVPWTVPF